MSQERENLYFYLPGCPHCKKAERYIEDICRITAQIPQGGRQLSQS